MVGAHTFTWKHSLVKMIDSNNPDIDVEALMRKVHLEVDRRKLASPEIDLRGGPGRNATTAQNIRSLLAIAEEKARVRSQWSGKLSRFPFTFAPFQRISLKLLAFLFKDQRHVNFSLIQAVRECVSWNLRMAEHVDLLRARLNASDERERELSERIEAMEKRLQSSQQHRPE